MKKLLFVLAFAFISSQAMSQIYLVTLNQTQYGTHPSGCLVNAGDFFLTKTDPTGVQTYTCIPFNLYYNTDGLSILNQELNSIINQGYKLIEIDKGEGGLVDQEEIRTGITWYFAIPWSASGLEEVTTTLNSLSISPNPANEFVNISLSYDLKGESEIVFISEAAYVYHKESIASISKNETYNIDISRIPAGKYLVTIKNGKTYTTPQKLIIL